MSLNISEINTGMPLTGLQKKVVQENVKLYAEASRDYNPIHTNEEFAKKTPAGGTIAHGMLILAYLSQMLNENFGRDWLSGGKLNVRFKTPARPGDFITISGKINRLDKANDITTVYCEVICENQKGEAVISGDASVRIKI
jgi:3-hydroxybutyryl-CoA dehydratase